MTHEKITAVLLSLLLALSFAACPAGAEAKKLSVVTTIFPIYDWVREIVGTDSAADLTLLLDNGVDLHSYQPTAADVMKIATCDVFIYVGGESDDWVEDALQEAVNKDMIVVNLVEAMGEEIRTEEIVEGMEHDHEHDHDDDHDEDHDEDHDHDYEDHDEDHDHDDEDHDHDEDHDEDHDHEEHDHDHDDGEVDEHVWLSLRNAQKLVGAITETLCRASPASAEGWRANAAAYTEKLAALDQEYSRAVESASTHTVLFGDRFPFRYLTEDYSLTYYAAFSGCSAETEVSFQTIVFLAGKVDELHLPAVLTIEGTNHKAAETVVGTTAEKNQLLLTLNSMQGTTKADINAGTMYLSVMESNLEVLKQALR